MYGTRQTRSARLVFVFTTHYKVSSSTQRSRQFSHLHSDGGLLSKSILCHVWKESVIRKTWNLEVLAGSLEGTCERFHTPKVSALLKTWFLWIQNSLDFWSVHYTIFEFKFTKIWRSWSRVKGPKFSWRMNSPWLLIHRLIQLSSIITSMFCAKQNCEWFIYQIMNDLRLFVR